MNVNLNFSHVCYLYLAGRYLSQFFFAVGFVWKWEVKGTFPHDNVISYLKVIYTGASVVYQAECVCVCVCV